MTTDPTDTTDAPKAPEDTPWGALADAIATSNRAAQAHAAELRRLTVAVVFAAILITGVYVLEGKR